MTVVAAPDTAGASAWPLAMPKAAQATTSGNTTSCRRNDTTQAIAPAIASFASVQVGASSQRSFQENADWTALAFAIGLAIGGASLGAGVASVAVVIAGTGLAMSWLETWRHFWTDTLDELARFLESDAQSGGDDGG